jgi:proteic killer suppression protein
MILSYADDVTRGLADGRVPRGVPLALAKQAAKRLSYLKAAARREDLFIPPSNRFHALSGTGRYAVWVNDQWRLSFNWPDGASGPADVRFEDYH